MKTLYLLRHGHAEPSIGNDKERNLSATGQRQVQSVADQFMAKGWQVPDMIVCSSAKRTVQTLNTFSEKVEGERIDTNISDDMYLAREHKWITTISSLPNDKNTVIFVGHNPGIEQIASSLNDTFIAFETGTLLKLESSADRWDLFDSQPVESSEAIYPV